MKNRLYSPLHVVIILAYLMLAGAANLSAMDSEQVMVLDDARQESIKHDIASFMAMVSRLPAEMSFKIFAYTINPHDMNTFYDEIALLGALTLHPEFMDIMRTLFGDGIQKYHTMSIPEFYQLIRAMVFHGHGITEQQWNTIHTNTLLALKETLVWNKSSIPSHCIKMFNLVPSDREISINDESLSIGWNKESLLLRAAQRENIPVLKQLLTIKNIDPNHGNAHKSPLCGAVGSSVNDISKTTTIITLLLEAPGIDVNRHHPLHHAIILIDNSVNFIAIIQQLLDAKDIDINAESKSSGTALSFYLNYSNSHEKSVSEAIPLFLQHGARVKESDLQTAKNLADTSLYNLLQKYYDQQHKK